MLSLAEFRAAESDLVFLGERYEAFIADALIGVTDRQAAVSVVRSFMPAYQAEYEALLRNAMYEGASTVLAYYGEEDIVPVANEIVQRQFNEKYYGMTLDQRLKVNQRRLARIIQQTAQVGIPQLTGIFSQRVPFGAQTNVDKRILQGTMAKVEQDAAKQVATTDQVELIRWKLAASHKIACRCEDYANRVNDNVVKYIQKHRLDIRPRGLYFRDQLPHPPHPNCQCEYQLATPRRTTPVKRALTRIFNLIARIRGKR